MKLSKEFKVGLLALVTGVLFYFGFKFLKGADFFSTSAVYYAIYDKIDGLTVSNPVMLNGMIVGRVDDIEIVPEENYKVKITMHIDNNLILKENSKANLGDNGLLGGKAIFLDLSKEGNKLASGSVLDGKVANGLMGDLQNQLTPVMKKFTAIMEKFDTILVSFTGKDRQINNIFNNLDRSTAGLNRFVNALDPNDLNITMQNFRSISESFKQTEKSIKPMIDNANGFVNKLNKLELEATLDNTKKMISELNTILAGINKGEGTMGALMKSDTLYNNMNNISRSLDRLLVDFRENPKRYVNISVFGKKDKEVKK